MKKFLFLLLVISFISCDRSKSKNFKTVFEISNGTKSAAYEEGIEWWQNFAGEFREVQMQEFGMTDAGYPLHIITLSSDGRHLDQVIKSKKSIILINNAIHPGEPDGVDASMMLLRDILRTDKELLDSCIVVCIPYYNIGGALNRNSHSRTNQDGPEEYGFRGNAQNLDLNRDFVKCDSRNAESFAKLLQILDPDMYVETHVSNGADYQYTMTYLSTQPDKLGYEMGTYLREGIIPNLEKKMEAKGNAMVPYVNHWGGPLDKGYATFYDSPRYSSGLTTLHSIFGFITETHMLKPFDQRVKATYDYLMSSIEFCNENSSEIKRVRALQKKTISQAQSLPIDWNLDSDKQDTLQFKGYEYGYKKSDISGKDRLYYDRAKPTTKTMFYQGYMKENKRRLKPYAYILRRGFTGVEDRLRWNGVELTKLENDTTIQVVSFKILDFKTSENPYEKHYLHYNTSTSIDTMVWQFRKGDYLIKMGTEKDRFILEMLEPEGPDSYFNWNFFDAILQQKEHFSTYVFEDRAAELLRKNPELKAKLDLQILINTDSRGSMTASEQLEWIYLHSPHYEKEHNRLPIFKLMR
ncbi:MAG: hypothetical protein COA58_14360 [Bacteroidetes bacterium]|nr:MAG: hypothetical protein COA58_14360 [Bacteroidota bacterium]